MDATLATLSLDGPDATSFLQGQTTQDTGVLSEHTASLGALLTPQGRVIAAPWLIGRPNGIALVLPAALSRPIEERLTRYRLRAKVTFRQTPLSPEDALKVATRLGMDPTDSIPTTAQQWYALHVRAGVAFVDAAHAEHYIPQMLNLDLLGAVSFTKGCYTGQEIVARTQHLGRIKRRLYRLHLADAQSASIDDAVLADGAKIGEIVMIVPSAGGHDLLAVLNCDQASDSLTLEDGRRLATLPLPYPLTPSSA